VTEPEELEAKRTWIRIQDSLPSIRFGVEEGQLKLIAFFLALLFIWWNVLQELLMPLFLIILNSFIFGYKRVTAPQATLSILYGASLLACLSTHLFLEFGTQWMINILISCVIATKITFYLLQDKEPLFSTHAANQEVVYLLFFAVVGWMLMILEVFLISLWAVEFIGLFCFAGGLVLFVAGSLVSDIQLTLPAGIYLLQVISSVMFAYVSGVTFANLRFNRQLPQSPQPKLES